jgi:hypothetical protein
MADWRFAIERGDSMILRLATLHENGLRGAKSFTFNKSFRHFHGLRLARRLFNRQSAIGIGQWAGTDSDIMSLHRHLPHHRTSPLVSGRTTQARNSS